MEAAILHFEVEHVQERKVATASATFRYLKVEPFLVEGRMDVDQWQDKQSGAKRSRMKVVAENVQFLRIRRPEDEARPVPAPATGPFEESAEFKAPRRARRAAAKAVP